MRAVYCGRALMTNSGKTARRFAEHFPGGEVFSSVLRKERARAFLIPQIAHELGRPLRQQFAVISDLLLRQAALP